MHEIGLVHFLDGVFFFAEGGGERAEADRPAGIFIEQRDHEVAVDFVEAVFIDAEHVQRFLSDFAGDAAGGADFGKIAGAAQKAIGDARRAAATAGDFFGAGIVHLDIQNFGGAVEDDEQIFRLVEIEAMDDAEAGAQRRGDESGARGGADEREMVQVEGMNARAGALADDEVDAKIFHGGIEDFFDGGLQAMNFVEKENFLCLEGSEDGGEVAFAFEQRAGAGFDGNIEFVGDDLGERGFAEARRAVEENVIEGFAAVAGGFDGDGDVFLDALLADVFVEALGADAGVEARVIVRGAPETMRGGDRCWAVSWSEVVIESVSQRSAANDTSRLCDYSSDGPPLTAFPAASSFTHLSCGALRATECHAQQFFKVGVPASRLASATAASAVRSS